jgi:hypothetical protein
VLGPHLQVTVNTTDGELHSWNQWMR